MRYEPIKRGWSALQAGWLLQKRKQLKARTKRVFLQKACSMFPTTKFKEQQVCGYLNRKKATICECSVTVAHLDTIEEEDVRFIPSAPFRKKVALNRVMI